MRKPGRRNKLADVPARLVTIYLRTALGAAARPAVVGLATLFVLVGLASPAAAQHGAPLSREEWRARQAEILDGYGRVLDAHREQYAKGPVVELVTMGVGGLIWERHGHIALCIADGPMKHDCYNYGVGDFHHPLSMVWGFFRGTHSFYVKKDAWEDMMQVYLFADRTIWAQPLPLTPAQVAKVEELLAHDDTDENRYYAYDHLWDNCTTRVRDILDKATDGALSKMPNKTDGRTFRELAREGFLGREGGGSQWLPLLATDMSMGRNSDQVPSYYERMFLPDYLREAIEVNESLKTAPIVVYQRKGPLAVKELEKQIADPTRSPEDKAQLQARLDDLHSESSGRLGFALFVLLLTAPAWITRLVGRFERTGLAFAVIPTVLLGTIYWFLAIISPLPYVRWNETCLLLMPFDILLLVGPQLRRQRYARGRVAMLGLVALLMLVHVIKAPLWPAWLWVLVPNAVAGFLPRKQVVEKIAAPTEGAGEVKKAKA